VRDVVVVGGGIAGLVAAWELRDLDTLVLEAEDQVGGRIKSVDRGDHWVSVGGHMFPGQGSYLWELMTELELEPARIQGSLLGIAQQGKIVVGGRAETFPFRLPLSAAARISFARSGLRVKRDAARYNALSRPGPGETASDVRARLLGFLDDRSWATYLGPVHPQVEAIFRTTANRLTAEPDEVAAGCMVGLFAHVWANEGVVLGYNLRSGPSSLPRALADRLGDCVQTGAQVTRITPGPDGVRVAYRHGDAETEVAAHCAIVTAAAPLARVLIDNLPEETAAALDAVVYGPFVVGGILTGETGPMPWDDIYSILTVEGSFTMLFNHANSLRTPGQPREEGGALMVYAGANAARKLFDKSDDEIAATFADDLARLYPEARGIVREVIVQRWEHAIPFAAPGRSRVQAALERGVDGTIFFAGDYVGEWTHMESAALTASEAATAVRARLATTAAA
jgi:oxygen-dependent protoporphyrinogen oxidase